MNDYLVELYLVCVEYINGIVVIWNFDLCLCLDYLNFINIYSEVVEIFGYLIIFFILVLIILVIGIVGIILIIIVFFCKSFCILMNCYLIVLFVVDFGFFVVLFLWFFEWFVINE